MGELPRDLGDFGDFEDFENFGEHRDGEASYGSQGRFLGCRSFPGIRENLGIWGSTGVQEIPREIFGMQDPAGGSEGIFLGCTGMSSAPSTPTVWLSRAGASGNFSRLQLLRSTFYSN